MFHRTGVTNVERSSINTTLRTARYSSGSRICTTLRTDGYGSKSRVSITLWTAGHGSGSRKSTTPRTAGYGCGLHLFLSTFNYLYIHYTTPSEDRIAFMNSNDQAPDTHGYHNLILAVLGGPTGGSARVLQIDYCNVLLRHHGDRDYMLDDDAAKITAVPEV